MTNLEAPESIYRAFGRGDIPHILGLLAEDVAWDHELPSYGVAYLEPSPSREDVAKFFAGPGSRTWSTATPTPPPGGTRTSEPSFPPGTGRTPWTGRAAP